MSKYLLAIAALLSLFAVFPARADDPQAKEVEIPTILQPEHRTKRPLQFELVPYAGSYLGNTVGQTWTAGGKAYFHVDNTYSFGVNGAYARLATDRSSTFGRELHNNDMYLFDAETMISNDLAMRIGKKLFEIDLYLTLGVGAISINENIEPMGVIGGGVKIYTPIPWLAVRVDMNNYAHYTQKPGDDNFDFDVTFIGGPSFMFPSQRPKNSEKK